MRVEWNDGDRLLARCSCGALWGVAASVLPGYLNYAAAGRRALVLEPDRPGVQLFKSGRPG